MKLEEFQQRQKQFVWLDEKQEGQPLPKRRRTGEKGEQGLGHNSHPHTSRKTRERISPTIKEVLLSYIPQMPVFIIY